MLEDPNNKEKWWKPSDLAERDGLTRQAISMAVAHLVEVHGLPVQRSPGGRVMRVDRVRFDKLRGKYADPARTRAARAASTAAEAGSTTSNPQSYDEALRQKTWADAEQRRLNLEREKGTLLRADKVAAVLAIAGQEMIRSLDRLPTRVDDVCLAVVRDGEHGARRILRQIAQDMRREFSAALRSAGMEQPEFDPLPEPSQVAGQFAGGPA